MGYTDKKYWNNYWKNEPRGGSIVFYFDALLNKFIPWERIHTYMEIGGAPGSILTYMYREHGLKISTIDFTDKSRMVDFMRNHGVYDCEIITEDFQTFDVDNYKKSFDIVASWGFIEHFEKSVAAGFISKMKSLVNNEGYLIIELPNIRKLFC